ncbi:MAG: hypothetical protein MR471_03990 [Clostridia bacterium]|nr:hypothetical protein [Clostridia bacterium]MDY3784318.1 hypothetical protein [Eubacteriales bacterium]
MNKTKKAYRRDGHILWRTVIYTVSIFMLATAMLLCGCSNKNNIPSRPKDPTPHETEVPFEGNLSNSWNIKIPSDDENKSVADWIAECDKESADACGTYVLMLCEALSDGNTAYSYLIYSRILSADYDYKASAETLKTSAKEIVNITYSAPEASGSESSGDMVKRLDFIRYVGQREPELNIIEEISGENDCIGYIKRTSSSDFGNITGN